MNLKEKNKKGIELYQKAKEIIPGGTGLLSKRPEMFLPDLWPSYYQKAKGCYVWDLDDNKYLDFSSMGIGACILGYADDDVNQAVKEAIDNGSMNTLNCPEEVELAQMLLKIHSWAGMVRFARTGGESMAVAVRIARAFSGKDKIAFCGYHGWADWYLAANLADDKNLDGHLLAGLTPNGVPRGLAGTMLPFHFNKIEELEKIVKENQGIGLIVMEPMKFQEDTSDFLTKVRRIATQINAVLIFDEITVGFRFNIGGAHLELGITPDMAVFAKGISNGFPMGAIIGKKEIMQAAQTSFISSTYWTERIGPTAAIATINKMARENVPEYLEKIGLAIKMNLLELAKRHNIDLTVEGKPAMLHITFNYFNHQAIRTLFTQEMLKRGVLASGGIYVSLAFEEKHLKEYFKAVDEVFPILAKSIEANRVETDLEGPIAHSTFQRLNSIIS
ncbi:MAG: aminotransferase class III-fold pyridoxal phosphate-dependent enzyme [Candidatus Pacebacteria bacterium]|nr:aminotransferase class III-fold pyridoxal phosphate-dependent enzyme [Candidatus Paceibacterota bacterium]